MTYKVPMIALRMVRERTLTLPGSYVRGREQAAEVAKHYLRDKPVEYLIAILLDGKGHITSIVRVGQGGMHGAGVRVADVLRAVLVGHATAFVLAHNHPSGDPAPSREDVNFTRAIAEGARIVDCPLLDHVVVAGDEFRNIEVST